MSQTDMQGRIEAFVNGWENDPAGFRDVFTGFLGLLETLEGANIEFIERPGVTYSLRASHGAQASRDGRPLFVMVDVIDDDPANRWLSVCFFGDMITDPEELGNFVPGGLMGSDGHCFDLDAVEEDMLTYLTTRIAEAYGAAKG